MTMKRKPPDERKQIIPLSLDPDVVEWMDKESGTGSRSAFANNILRGTMEVAEQFDEVEFSEINPDTTKKKSKIDVFNVGEAKQTRVKA